MPELKIWDEYSRRAVHDIFAPSSPFTPQAGTWGLQGIIELPEREGDFVLFVTFGREEGGHEFDEGISAEGVLRWQSQPKQTLADKTVRRLIEHDETKSSIYLFLRTRARQQGEPSGYTYLGRLKYVTHDRQRERPVHFDWQLVSWPIPRDAIERMGLRLEGPRGADPATEGVADEDTAARSVRLIADVTTPTQGARNGSPTRLFQARVVGDYGARERANRSLGLAGERLVVQFEQEALRELGLHHLASQVRHVAFEEGDGAGYDVLSFEPGGRARYIEVKTTRGPITSEFFLSPNEIAFSRVHPDAYELRRLYGYDKQVGTCHFFSLRGDLGAQFELTPTEFKISNLRADRN